MKLLCDLVRKTFDEIGETAFTTEEENVLIERVYKAVWERLERDKETCAAIEHEILIVAIPNVIDDLLAEKEQAENG